MAKTNAAKKSTPAKKDAKKNEQPKAVAPEVKITGSNLTIPENGLVVNVQDIKNIMAKISVIGTSKIIPVYDYIKIVCEGDTATFQKSIGHKIAVGSIPAEFNRNMTLIVEEKKLSFADFAIGEKISIHREDSRVILSDGRKWVSGQTIDDTFTQLPEPIDDKVYEMDAATITALKLASNHASPGKGTIRHWHTYISVQPVLGKSYVAGTNGAITFMQELKDVLPDVILDPDMIKIIFNQNMVFYSDRKNFHWFEAGNVSYGLAKEDSLRYVTLEPLMKNFKTDEKMTLPRKDIIRFCEQVIAINSFAVEPRVQISDIGGDKIMLKFMSLSDDETAEDILIAENKNFTLEEPFLFQPNLMITVLNSVDSEKVTFGRIKHHFLITSDDAPGYLGDIMEVSLPPAVQTPAK